MCDLLLPFGVFGVQLALLVTTLDPPIEVPVGPVVAYLAPKGLSLGSLWLPFGNSGRMPPSPFGAPCLPEFIPELIPQLPLSYQSYFERLRCLCIKNGLAELCGLPVVCPPDPWFARRKWRMARSSQPLALAPGARMTVVKQTPSN